jgi:hypothetical protein
MTAAAVAQHLPAPRGARDGGDAAVRGKTGDQTGQESRSAGHRAAASMTAMDITILAFYRDTLGFEIRPDRGELAIAIGLSISGLPVRL